MRPLHHVLLPVFLLAAGCPSSVISPTGGNGGAGGNAGGAGGSAGEGGQAGQGGAGPCLSANDCVGLNGACVTGTCINGSCTTQPANDGQACNDGKFCTTGDTCQSGACVGGNTVFCPSPDPCHLGLCDEATQGCKSAPGNDGASCDDGDACTYDGACQSGACAPGQQIDCSFLDDPCHAGQCQQGQGCVQVTANEGLACDDGLFCTMNDVCAAGACDGVPLQCAPLSGCFISTCNEASDSCVAVAGNDGLPCDDFNSCSAGTTCLGGACIGGVPANEGQVCDDGTSCTTGESCTGGVCGGGMGPTVYFADDFKDNSKGWTLGPEWAIGPAQPFVGGPCGGLDPANDHSPSADDGIAGVALGGSESPVLHPWYYLESPTFDTSGAPGTVIFQFWRMLESDYHPFMHNNVEVWDGAQWVILAQWPDPNLPGCFADLDWTYVSFDVTALKNPAMRVRFGFDVGSGGVFSVASWNLDDVMVASAACQ